MQIRRYGPTVKSRRMRPASRTGRSRRRFSLLLPSLALTLGALSLFAAGPAQAQSSDATLSGLAVEVSTDGMSFSSIGFIPEYSAGQRSYDTAVQPSYTHARLTPSASHAAAALQVGKAGSLRAVSNGSPSAAIALDTGGNAILVKVTAEDGSVRHYTMTVTRGGRAFSSPPRNVQVSAGDGSLTLTWEPPAYWGSFPPGGYDVDWYAGASLPTDELDWNRATRSVVPLAPTATSYEFTGTYDFHRTSGKHTVTNGTTYQLRLRAFGTNPDDSSDRLPSYWVTTADFPMAQAQSSNADLSSLTASSGTSASGTFTALTLSPSTFSAAATSYTATVVNARTQAKVTPMVAHSAATVGWRKGNTGNFTSVSSGSAIGAIALSVGANAITVRVTAQDGTTKDYTVTITRQAATTTPTVSLSASPNPVTEGSSVTVTAALSRALTSNVTIPVTITDNSAEPTDHGTLTSITINSGATSGTGTITTNQDPDEDDETFTVALGSLPSSVRAGSPSSVRVTIRDDDDGGGGTSPAPTVSLSAAPNPVDEGLPVTVTARLSSALANAVTIPLAVTAGTAEPGDFGALASITIPGGSSTGTGTIATSEDTDTDDETFTVALGSLPSSVTAGSPGAVEVTILDDDPRNRAPTVSASCDPCRVGPGGEVRLTARASDPDGDPLTYAWSAPAGRFSGPADEAAARWRASAETGRVTIRVRVSDGRGGTASATVSIEVANAPPAFGEPSYRFRLRENEDGRGRPVPLGAVVAEDPDGDEVKYALASGAGHLFAVGVGDGAVTYVGPGEDYETEPNRYELTVRARDPHGAEALAPVVVEVVNVNEPPVAAADTARTAEDTEVVIDVLANDTDAEGDVLRIESLSRPTHGMARAAANGGVEYAPEADWHGTDRFTYTVTDGNGGTAEAEVEVVVEPVNDAPEAVADTAATAEDEPVVIDVLANDTDVEGDALRVESVTAPSHGTARVAANGGVEYAPEADWYGTDRFTYTVSDGNGGTATAEVVVVVEPVNDAPEAVADTAATAEDEPVVIDVLANDTDVEGDALRVESVTAPSHGTARAVASGGVEYAPEADYHGPDRFTYTVADGNGGTAEAEVVVAVASVNDAPEAVGAIPEQALDEGAGSVALDLAPYFEDRDGDPLAYTAVSSDPGVAAVSVAGSALTLTPVGYGPASIEVTARDPGGLSAAQTFAVNASDRMVRAVLDETLAAMARAHLASARMTLGRRVGPGGDADERSRLTVRGRSIPLDRDAARQAAGRLLEGWAVSRLWRGGGLVEAGREAERRLARLAANAANGRARGGPPGPADLAASLGLNGLGAPVGLGAPGGGTEFLFAWGGGEPGAQDAGSGGRWRFWGQGDLQTFAGDPVPERSYEGDLRTGWAGVDRALGERWLAGVAVARSSGGGDWRAGTAGGRLETSLTAVHPYLRWSDGATSVWTMAGGGRGSAENERATGLVGESDLGLGLGLVEIRRRLTGWFGLRADAAWARLATGAGPESVDDRSAAVDQQRLGIELAPSTHLGALALELFGEASARRDGGAGQTGSGLEVAGGFRAAGGSVRIDAQGRILVLHSAEGYEERGLGVTLSVGSPSDEEGLSLSVSPRWGGPAATSGALWEERLGGLGPPGPAADGPWSLDARGRYALRLPDGRLLAWSGGFSRSEGGWGLTIGGGLELAARESPTESPR